MRAVRFLRHAPLAPVLLAAVAGILVADRPSWIAGGFAFLGLLGAAIALGKAFRNAGPDAGRNAFGKACHPLAVLLLASAIALAGVAWRHTARLDAIRSFPLSGPIAGGHSVEIEGSGWFASRPDRGERSVSGIVEIESITVASTRIPCRHRLPVWIRQVPGEISYGTPLQFSGLVRPLESPEAPGGFDPASFYFRHSGSLARLEIREGDRLVTGGATGDAMRGSPLVAAAQHLRGHLEAGLLTGLDPADEPYARLIAAMSLGARENSPEELEDAFRRSGTMHLFAVSGLHVGVVGGLLLGTLLLLRVPKRTAVLVVIPLLLFYALLTGLRPSAVRAAIMFSVFLAGFALREEPRLLNSLALAGLLILLADTQQLFLPGFQLSFAVLLSIALFAEAAQRRFAAPWLTDPFLPRSLAGPVRRVKDRLVVVGAGALAVSLFAWLGSTGLLAWHFQSLSPVGIVANLFLVPLAGIIVTIAAASLACFALKLPWLTALLNQVNVGIAIVLSGAAGLFADLPGAHRHVGHAPPNPGTDSAMVLDVFGRGGDGALLLTFPGGGKTRPAPWMIDTGGGETWRRQVLPLLRSRSVNRIGGLVLTHGDIGHIGAAPDLLAQFRPTLLFEPASANRSPAYPEILALAESRRIRRIGLSAGQRLRPHPDVVLDILSPRPESAGRLADDRALVARLSYRNRRILLTSDAGFDTEKTLLEAGVDLRADLWIRGQHSGSPSGLPSFVDAVGPAAVVSSSDFFPASEQLGDAFRDHLARAGAELFPLDETGVVTVTVGGDTLEIACHRRPGDPWRHRFEAAP